MRYWLIPVILLACSLQVEAQAKFNISKPKPVNRRPTAEAKAAAKAKLSQPRLEVNDLLEMLDWEDFRIDTTLKRKGYLLMQKDVDSTSSLFQYSNVTHKEDEPIGVRSISYMDATIRNMKARMISYRTYDKEEFRDISGYLLANNYQPKNKFDFDEARHTIYSNGTQEIRVKVITSTAGKKTFTAYELELGK